MQPLSFLIPKLLKNIIGTVPDSFKASIATWRTQRIYRVLFKSSLSQV